jgi:hypothetical protein
MCGRESAPRLTRVRQGKGPCKWCGYGRIAESKRLGDESARAVMRAAHFEPSAPYVDGGTPWHGHCLICGQEGAPTYKFVKSGGSPCKRCGRERIRLAQSIDPDVALRVMLAAGFQPEGAYPGSGIPWPGSCRTCGTPAQPSYYSVSVGHHPCRKCAMKSAGASRRERDADNARAEMLLVGFEPSGPYPGSHGRWAGTCLLCGHVGTASIHTVRQGQGACKPCGTKRTADRQRTPETVAREVMFLRDFEPQVPYVNSSTPWEGVCLKCGTVSSPMYSNVVTGSGPCRPCGVARGGLKRRVDAAAARLVMLDAGFAPFDDYRGSSDQWRGVCLRCGSESSPSYSRVAGGGDPCRKCSAAVGGQKRRLDTDAAVGTMLKANFQPSLPFPGSEQPWPGVCLTCGMPGTPRYKHVSRGIGACAYCSGIRPDSAVLLGKALAAGFLPNGPYLGAREPWAGSCMTCGNAVSPMMTNILKGRGACRSCGSGGFDPNVPGWFYVLTDGQIMKGGITNIPDQRLYTHSIQGLDRVLHLVEFASGRDAAALEGLWMEYLAPRKMFAVEKARLPDGYTEAIYLHDGLEQFVETLVGLGVPRVAESTTEAF